MHSAKELSLKLKENLPAASFLDSLKISYRPYICPFGQLLSLIKKESKIFDIGCGSGMFLMLAAEYCNPIKLGGIEISNTLVANARSLLSSYPVPVQLEQYDGIHIPDYLYEYDIVFMIDVFHHVPVKNQELILRAIYNAMKPGSTLVFKDIDASKKVLTAMNKMHDLILSGEIGKEVSSLTAEKLLTAVGFEILSNEYIRTLWYPHYLIICKK